MHRHPQSLGHWGHMSLQWRQNGRDSVSNYQPHDCLLNCLLKGRSKKTLKLRVPGLCAGNSPGTGEFPTQMASYVENVSIWWRHHVLRAGMAVCPELGPILPIVIPNTQQSCWGIYWFHLVCLSVSPSVCLSVCSAFRVRSVTPTVLNGFFPYWTQLITIMRGCVLHNDLWPWHISFRSFSHDFAIKLLRYGTSYHVCSTACTLLDYFPIWHKWPLACDGVFRAMTFDLDLYLQDHSAMTLS